MLKQRIKEYEKQRVYDEYKDKEFDLISGIIIGPYVIGHMGLEGIGLLSMEEVEKLKIISDVSFLCVSYNPTSVKSVIFVKAI